MRDYDAAVFIARLQPPHNVHIDIVRQALLLAERGVVVAGVARGAPDIRNPWSAAERKEMLYRCFAYEEQQRLQVIPVRDRRYNDTAWAADVHNQVQEHAGSEKVVLIGHRKDHTSFYLDLFPQWTLHDVGCLQVGLSATTIREAYFREGAAGPPKGWVDRHWHGAVPRAVSDYLEQFRTTLQFEEMAAQQTYADEYRERWSAVPFPPTFVTTDAVVVQSGHVLLVRRGANPGKGKLALPGGFIDQDRSLEDCALRELKEETRLKVDQRTLRACIQGRRVFDHPERSTRGRTVTHAFYFRLPDASVLPAVKGDSDAAGAMWVPLGDVHRREAEFFEDHLDIIEHFTTVH